jgi:hypothetical protein
MLPIGDIEGGGHDNATDEPAPQKLLAGQSDLVLLDVHRLPAGHVVEVVLPGAQ